MSMKQIDNNNNSLGVNNSDNQYVSDNVLANENGSILERMEDLKNKVNAGKIQYNSTNYLAVVADFSSATWNTIATHEVFTVTGLVRMKVVAEVTINLAGATATIELGYDADTDAWIATTTGTDLDAGDIWSDETPTEVQGNYSSMIFDKVVNGVDIGYEIKVAALTAGSITFHCWYEALNATGAVVAGSGGVLV